MSITVCRACGAEIRFVRTKAKARFMPLDPEPNPDGNVEIVDGLAIVHAQPPLSGELYMPHHATCPNWPTP